MMLHSLVGYGGVAQQVVVVVPHMTSPTMAAEMRVPPKARALMAPMLRKKGFTCSEKPASNMIGGSSAMKKNSVCNAARAFSACHSDSSPQCGQDNSQPHENIQ